MSPENIANIVIIGGGVVGLAALAELAQTHQDIFLLEAKSRVGTVSSTRNSGVIHAGMYYKTGSLKATHCVSGVPLLYEFCARHHIPHQRIGKLIVADALDQLPELEALKRLGDANGVEGLAIVDRAFIQKREPHLASPAALYSPNTGIIEAEALVNKLADIAQARGAHILPGSPVTDVEVKGELVYLRTPHETIAARTVINSAGLYADEIARKFGYDKHTIYPCRGEYAEVVPSRRHLINGLVYPLPLKNGHGLGMHLTPTTGGRLLVGPNSRYRDSKEDYEGDPATIESFHAAALTMLPDLQIEDLRLSYSGLRPRLQAAHESGFVDWAMEYDPQYPQVIHLIGMESPALTSCLSLALHVSEMVSMRQ
jgi:L-2-hydroxyglutarate oxidase LhgO